MKKLFLEVRKKFGDIDLSLLNNLPGKTISLAATIQYICLIPVIKSYLEKRGKKVIIKQGPKYSGHVLGCNSSAFDVSSETLLLIADGKFHAINNSVSLQKEIYIYNARKLEKVTLSEIEEVNKKTRAKKSKFLMSEKVGVLVSTKPGQNYNIGELKSKIEKKGKKVYIFESNDINMGEFENFPQIKIWINTACPGLSMDNPKIINHRDILEFL